MAETSVLINPSDIGAEWLDIFLSSGADILGIHPVAGRAGEKHLLALLETVKTDEFRSFIDKVNAAGKKTEYQIHAMSHLLPRDLFSSHPEYFRVDESGKRTAEFNLCPSSEDALRIVSENARVLASQLYGSSEKYYFWTDDVKGSFCRCEKCRGLSPSDQAMMIYNAILAGVRKFRGDAKVCYLAYQDAMLPPSAVKKSDGVFLEFAPIDRDLSLPLTAEKNAETRRVLAPLLDFFGRKDSRVLEYWVDNSLFCKWSLPYRKLPFYPEVIAADAEYYTSLGFEGLSSFACFLGPAYIKEFGTPPINEFIRLLNEK